MDEIIRELFMRAQNRMGDMVVALSVAGFREIGAQQPEEPWAEIETRVERLFVVPHNASAVLIGYELLGEYTDISCAIGSVRPGYNIYRGAETHQRASYFRERGGVSDLLHPLGMVVAEILENGGVTKEDARALPQIYKYLEDKGFSLQPVDRGVPFVFANEEGDEVKIHRLPTEVPIDPYWNYPFSYEEGTELIMMPDSPLMVEEYEKGNPHPVFSVDVQTYMDLRVKRDAKAGADPLLSATRYIIG